MTSWLRARSVLGSVVLAMMVPVLAFLTTGVALPIPFLRSWDVPVQTAPLVAVLLVVAVGLFESTDSARDRVSSRRIRLLSGCVEALLLGIAAGGAALAVPESSGIGGATARNCVGLLGALWILLALSPRVAVAVTVAGALFVALVARSLDEVPERWAWVVAAADNASSWWWALSLFVVGGVLRWVRSARPEVAT